MKNIIYILTVFCNLMYLNAQAPTNGLVAYYPFNGNANDESGNGNNASQITTNVSFVDGIKGGTATKFGGYYSPGHISVPNSSTLKFANEAAFSFWLRIDDAAGMDGWGRYSNNGVFCVFSKDHDRSGIYSMSHFSTEGKLHLWTGFIYGSDAVNSKPYSGYEIGKWVHIVYNFTSSFSTLYINGIKDTTNICNFNFSYANSQDLFLGKFRGSWYPLNGALDEFRIYNRALHSDEVAKIYNYEKPAVNYSTVQPQILVSNGVVDLNGKVVVSGKGFTPLGNVNIILVSNCGGLSNDITADSNGNFTYTYTAPSVIASSTGCEVIVYAKDVKSDIVAPVKTFKITVPVTPNTASINIINPKGTYKTSQPITVTWTEMLYKTASGISYPFSQSTGKRSYSYSVQYKTSETGEWKAVENAKELNGSQMFDEVLIKTIQFNINEPHEYCQVRVVDNYNLKSVGLSDVFSVVSSVVNTQLEWDYSFPNRDGNPQGVAADGVARIYLKIVKKNTTDDIKNILITLKADGVADNSTQMLGKIMSATVTDQYSEEANSANSTTVVYPVNVPSDAYWFWYVAPDNFAENGMSDTFAYKSNRTVQAYIKITYSNGSISEAIQDIKIVRPPLMMVHGLNGSEESFINFHYNFNNIDYYYRNSNERNPTSLFVTNKAVNLVPNASYETNAFLLVSPDCIGCGVDNNSSNSSNSFQGNIASVRTKKYASNQVDYVSHSMGGCMLREAIGGRFSTLFYGTKSQYKSYGKGFVHKAITIDTPHNGSPLADLVTEYAPRFSDVVAISYLFNIKWIKNFIIADRGNLYKATATDAVKNLQMQGEDGIVFKETAIKNHLIAGDVDILSNQISDGLASLEKYMDLIDNILEISYKMTKRPELKAMLALKKDNRVFSFMEWYGRQKGYNNFWGDGDLVVPLGSQLATESSTPFTTASSTIIKNSSWFNANHLQIVDQIAVGNRVLELLNSDVNGSLFANSIQANNVHSATGSGSSWAPHEPLLQKAKTSFDTFYNTDKIEISNPIRNNILFADSTLNLSYILKDTANLAYISYFCLGNSDITISRAAQQKISIQINPNFLGKQKIMVSAVYETPDGLVEYSDTLTVNVQTLAQLISFQVSPKIMYIYKGIKSYPTFKAIFSNGVVNVPYNNEDLNIEIDKPSIIQYILNDYSFVGMDTLSTFARITYNGISDTIYFVVMDTVSMNVPSGIENYKFVDMSNNSLSMVIYPNPANSFLHISSQEILQRIEICDISGRLIISKTINSDKCTIETDNFVKGIYIVKGFTNQRIFTGSFVKE